MRLGREKALERIGGKRLVEKAVDSLHLVSQEVLVVTSQAQFNNIASVNLEARVVVDLYPHKASLGGIYTGLSSANTLYGLIVACDMPFLNVALLRYMVELSPHFDIVIPRLGNKLEPLHAIYSKSCLGPIENLLWQGRLRIVEFFHQVRVRYVEETEIDRFDLQRLSFFNINTPADLERARELASRQGIEV